MPKCFVEDGRLHSAGEYGFHVLYLGGRGGDFGKVDAFAVEEVRGKYDVICGVVQFEVCDRGRASAKGILAVSIPSDLQTLICCVQDHSFLPGQSIG